MSFVSWVASCWARCLRGSQRSGSTVRSDVSEFDLHCPFCFRKVNAVFSRNGQTPYKGDYMVCPDCWGVGILRARTSYSNKWCITKPVWRELRAINEHQGVQKILREYEIARFGDGVSALQ